LKEIEKEELSFTELSTSLVKNISITSGFNYFSFFLLFLAKDILLYNWLNLISASNFTIFIGYLNAFIAFMLITPAVFPKFYQEIRQEKIHSFNKIILIILSLNFVIITVVFSIVIMVGFNFNIPQFTNISFFIMIIISVIVVVLFRIIESAFYGLKKSKEIGLMNLSVSLIFIIILLILRFFNMLNSYTVIILYIFTYLGGLGLGLYFYYNFKSKIQIPHNLEPIERRTRRDVLIFSYPLLIMNIFYFLNFRAGTIILGSFDQIYPIYYHLSTNLIIIFIGLLGIPISSMAYSYISEFFVKDNIDQIKKINNLILQLIAILEVTCLILIYIFSPVLIGFLYNDYYSLIFITLFKIITIAGIFYCIGQFLAKFPMANNKTKINLLAEIIAGISNTIFLILCIQNANLLFAGYGFLISILIIFVIYLVFCYKNKILSKKENIVFKIIFSSIISLGFYEIFYYFISIIWIGAIFSVLLYFTLIITLNITSIKNVKSMMKILFEIFKGIFSKKEDSIHT
jgi:O-antigen/teichoic acid export membrane protein